MQIVEIRVFSSKILLLLLLLAPFDVMAQFSDKPVEIDSFGKKGLYQNNKELNHRNLKAAMQSNSESTALMDKAAVNYTWSQVVGFIGGFALGWEAVNIIRGESVNVPVAAVGVLFTAGSFMLDKAYRDKSLEAVNIHNAYLKGKRPSDGETRMELKFGPAPSGVGFTLSF